MYENQEDDTRNRNIDDPVKAQERDHHAKEIAASESLFEGQPVCRGDKDRHEKVCQEPKRQWFKRQTKENSSGKEREPALGKPKTHEDVRVPLYRNSDLPVISGGTFISSNCNIIGAISAKMPPERKPGLNDLS